MAKSKANILLTGAFNYSEKQIKAISELGFETTFLQNEKDEITDYEKFNAVIANGLFLHHDISEFKNLKYIQLTSAGFDRVPMDYIKKNDIIIHNARGVYSIPMAEHAVLKTLELYKKSWTFYTNQQKGEWYKQRDILELYGKTVAIFGCGSVGLEIAKRLKAFGTHIIGVDILKSDSDYIEEYADISQIYDILPKADIVILTLPLNDETRGLFDKTSFGCMKESAIFINIARGQIVCENDLIDALKEQKIMGAALDVFEQEPLDKESELWELENVIITPHNSFVGEGNNKRMFEVIYKNLGVFING